MNGFFVIDKEEGWTSFDAVAKLRRLTGIKKAGHTGTLDPMATGVMLIMLGRATKLIQYLPSSDKRYTAVIKLGQRTDTLDRTGEVTAVSDKRVEIDDIKAVLPLFTGEIEQLPPMYSAVKKDGVRLYKLARMGETVQREQRKAMIYSNNILSFDETSQQLTLDIRCSEGTYIRTLADDLGERLGTYATLISLRRTEACGFGENVSVKIREIDPEKPLEKLIQPDTAFTKYSAVKISAAQSKRLINGGFLDAKWVDMNQVSSGFVRIYDDDGFAGLGRFDISDNAVSPVCMMRTSS